MVVCVGGCPVGSSVRRRPRALVVGLPLLAVLAAASATAVLGLWEPPLLVPGTHSSATGVVAVMCCLATAVVRRGRMRVAWSLFAGLSASYAAGDLLSALDRGGGAAALVDGLYVLGFLMGAAAMFAYPVVWGVQRMWRRSVLDAAVLAAAVLLIDHTLVIRTVLDRSDGAPDAVALTIYPLVNVLFVSVMLLLFLRTTGPVRADVVLLGLTVVLFTLGDNGYALMSARGQDHTGTLVDVAYTWAPLVLAAAALVTACTPTGRRTNRPDPLGGFAALLPDLVALLALAVVVAVGESDTLGTVLTAVTVASVFLRQVAQTRGGEVLRGRLERRVVERTEELAQLTEDYQALDTMKYQFVTAVSHELRTPLAAIRGSLEMLHDGDAGTLSPTARSVVSIAARGSERLSRLVNDIIDLERLESGAFGFVPGAHPVADLVEDAVGSLRRLGEERGVRVVADRVEGRAWCDSDRVVQVLVNLVGNALKFSPSGTTVTVGARVVGEEVLVSVSDQGRGIPESELESVFDRFHQVEIDDSRQQGGAGLGLAICQRIVERHGGRIWVESPGRGATFRFTLPLAAADQPADEPVDQPA